MPESKSLNRDVSAQKWFKAFAPNISLSDNCKAHLITCKKGTGYGKDIKKK